MRIAINATVITDKMAGTGYYAYHLLKKILEIDKTNEYIAIFDQASSLKKEFNASNLTKIITRTSVQWPIRQHLWENYILPFTLNRLNVDMYFSPSSILPLCKFKIPMVVTIHDIAWRIYPETKSRKYSFYLRYIMPNSSKNADMVIADSEHTKSDLIKFLKLPSHRIRVIYPGVPQKSYEGATINIEHLLYKKYGIKRDYILAVGTLERRKNIPRLIEAYVTLKEENKIPHQLVLVGKFKHAFRGKAKKLVQEYAHDIITTGYVSESDLSCLYSKARVFVYPSIYEGFGLPPMEAMEHGTPVATSNISSMPEVLGNSCLYFDPYDSHDIANKIYEGLENEHLRHSLITKGNETVKKFNWEETARDVLSIFGELKNQKRK